MIFFNKKGVKDYDYAFVSFPKNGRTWIRLFLNYYFFFKYPLSVTRRNAERYKKTPYKIPEIYYTHGGHDGLNSRKEKTTISKEIKKHADEDIVFLIRDPRDTVISYYHQLSNREMLSDKDTVNISLEEFLVHPLYGIERVIEFNNTWYGSRDSFKSFNLFSYEKFKSDKRNELLRLLGCFEEAGYFNEQAFEEAFKASSFEVMKNNEQASLHDEYVLSPSKKGGEEGFKVRKGSSGGFRNVLTSEQISYCNEKLKKLNNALLEKIDNK